MSETQKNELSGDVTVRLKLQNIELLKGSINVPASPNVLEGVFNFNINVETRADGTQKVLFVVVTVDVQSQDFKHNLGSLSASCIYFLEDFDQLVKIEPSGNVNMPKYLLDLLSSISISTTRGLMFSTFKGTFLHHAILPIVDASALQQQPATQAGK